MLSLAPSAAVARLSQANVSRCVSLPARSKLVKPFLRSSSRQRVHASSSDDDVCQTPATTSAAALAATPIKEDAGMFLDPLVRSLFLGVGAGIVCETLHVVTKVGKEGFVPWYCETVQLAAPCERLPAQLRTACIY